MFRDGTMVVSGSIDHRVIIWDAKSGAVHVKGIVSSVRFSRDSGRVISGSQDLACDKTVRVWLVETGELTDPLSAMAG
ncbi:hypothetical protein BDN67DRAFT_970235 [Paxillus ammoniavirescens]|nr:hypothetical protein BDN67DRAFT_970235 [Paxillus ammoniavirescens]